MATVSANKLELLQIADAVAREKAIDRNIVLGAMEDAIAKAARSRYGSETDVHAEIDPKSGELHLSRHMLVVEAVETLEETFLGIPTLGALIVRFRDMPPPIAILNTRIRNRI